MTTIADALFPIRPSHADSIQSWSTGLGVIGTDKARDSRPADPVWLQSYEAGNLGIIDTMIRRMIYAVPEYTLMYGWRTDEGKRRDVTKVLDRKLRLQARVMRADQMARCYGGSLILMVCKGVQDLAEPLPDGPHELAAVQVFTAREGYALAPFEMDLTSSEWGRPQFWSIQPNRQGLAGYASVLTRVHRSHVVYIPGLPKPDDMTIPGMLGYDLSVPQAYWERARDLGLARSSAAIAAMEQSMLALNMKGAAAARGSSGSASVAERLAIWDQGRSTRRVSVTVGDDSVTRLEAPLSGLSDIVRTQYEGLAAVEGYPLTWTLGTSPPGFGTDDEAGRRTVEQLIMARRAAIIREVLERIHTVALGEADRTYEFGPVFPPTRMERATRSKLLADRDAVLIASMVITADESRARINAEDGEEEAELPVLGADAPEEDEAEVEIDDGEAAP